LVMMAASVGVLLVVRIILALLLVLGPVFIAFALFAPTRGLFEGWLRTTVKFAVVPLFTLPFTAALVAVLIPFVTALDDTPIENFRDGPALAIVAITLVFAAVLFQAVRLAGGIAAGLRLPRSTVPAPAPVASTITTNPVSVLNPYTAPSRAEILVQSLAGSNGRDGRIGNAATVMPMTTRMIDSLGSPAPAIADTSTRLGQGYRRLVITSTATGTASPRRSGSGA
jgi:type IV secretion system protein VirB6